MDPQDSKNDLSPQAGHRDINVHLAAFAADDTAGDIIGRSLLRSYFSAPRKAGWNDTEILMIGWALTFLSVAVIAAILGFSGLAGASTGIAQLLFFIFLGLSVASVVAKLWHHPPT